MRLDSRANEMTPRRKARRDSRLPSSPTRSARRRGRTCHMNREQARSRSRVNAKTDFSIDRVRRLREAASRTAAYCGDCFRPSGRWSPSRRRPARSSDPICLGCTMDAIEEPTWRQRWRGSSYRRGDYTEPRWRRLRCLGCGHPMRLWPSRRPWRDPPLNAQACCSDCERTAYNRRQSDRRRVHHKEIACVVCGGEFVPTRSDATTCSNRCRQAAHRARRKG
jgi:hypothetical protein